MLWRQVEQQQDFKKGKGIRGGTTGEARSSRREGRKQKLSPSHDVSSNDFPSIFATWSIARIIHLM